MVRRSTVLEYKLFSFGKYRKQSLVISTETNKYLLRLLPASSTFARLGRVILLRVKTMLQHTRDASRKTENTNRIHDQLILFHCLWRCIQFFSIALPLLCLLSKAQSSFYSSILSLATLCCKFSSTDFSLLVNTTSPSLHAVGVIIVSWLFSTGNTLYMKNLTYFAVIPCCPDYQISYL